MFALSARMYLCRGDQLLRSSYLTCFHQKFDPLKEAEHSGSVHEKVLLFPPFRPIRRHVQIVSQNTFQYGRLAPRELSASQDSKKSVSHIGHTLEVVRGLCKTRHALRALLLLCALQKKICTSGHLLSSICTDTPCASPLRKKSSRSCIGVARAGHLALQYFARIPHTSIAQTSSAYSLKAFLKSPVRSRTKSSPPSLLSNSFSELMSS